MIHNTARPLAALLALALIVSSGCSLLSPGPGSNGVAQDTTDPSTWSMHSRCLFGYSFGGAATAELGLVVPAMITSCNGDCEQRKIQNGETISQAVHHHVRQRDDIIRYGSFAAVPIGALIGYGIGEYMCREEP